MNLRNVFVPKYIRFCSGIDEWAGNIIDVIESSDKQKPFFLFDEIFENFDRFRRLRQILISAYPASKELVSRSDEVFFSDDLTKSMIETASDMVVAIGGGKCLDMGKYSAFKVNLPFLSSPTQASHDGICSPRAVLKINSSVYSLPARTPMAIIVDLETIRTSPKRKIRAGIGDLSSNIVAVNDWRLGANEKQEPYDDFAATLSIFSAEWLFDVPKFDLEDPVFLEKFIHSLIFSGIAMEIAGSSRPASGAEHKISHAIDKLGFTRDNSHGEQVALGTLVSSVLQGGNWQRQKDFLIRASLPVKSSDIGINPDDFLKVLAIAPKIRPERYTILEKLSLDAQGYKDRLKPCGILE